MGGAPPADKDAAAAKTAASRAARCFRRAGLRQRGKAPD